MYYFPPMSFCACIPTPLYRIQNWNEKWQQFLYVCFSNKEFRPNDRDPSVSFFQVDFGEVFIPVGLDVPKPRVLPEFKRLAHGLRSSNISVLDAKTFYIPNLHYDGAGPDAYFWVRNWKKQTNWIRFQALSTAWYFSFPQVGNGSEPNIMGIKVNMNCFFLNYKTIVWTNESERNGMNENQKWQKVESK